MFEMNLKFSPQHFLELLLCYQFSHYLRGRDDATESRVNLGTFDFNGLSQESVREQNKKKIDLEVHD